MVNFKKKSFGKFFKKKSVQQLVNKIRYYLQQNEQKLIQNLAADTHTHKKKIK